MWHFPGLIADSGRVCEHPSMADAITRRDFMNGIAIAIVAVDQAHRAVAKLFPKREVDDAHVSKVI
jgi:hypothetical protein